MTTLMLLGFAHGASSLFLALLLGTLFAYRRRPVLLFWALAWLCNGLYLLAHALCEPVGPDSLAPFRWGGELWLPALMLLLGFWEAALWLLSLEPFYGDLQEKKPAVDGSLLLRALVVLLLASLLSLLLAANLSVGGQRVAVSLVLASVLSVGAFVSCLHWRRGHRLPALLLTAVLVLNALNNLHLSLVHLWSGENGLRSPYAWYAALGDLAAEILLAVATILFLIDGEQFHLRQATEQLEESEQQFRLIFEHSGVGMTLLARDGTILQANPTLQRMLGYEEKEIHSRPLNYFVLPSDLTKDAVASRVPDDSPSFYEREKRYVRKNGETIWARVLRVPIRDAEGKILHYVGVLMDISQRKRAEEQLAQSEQRYRLLNQVARDGIHVTDESGQFLEVNPAFCLMLGYETDALLRLHMADVAVDPDSMSAHLEAVLVRGGDRIETSLRKCDGSLIDVEMSGALLDLEGKKLLHGICRDVSENKRDQEKLQEERDFTRQVLETADVLIFVVDPPGRLVHFNGTCRTALGYCEEEVRGKPFWDVLLPTREAATARATHRQLVSTPDAAPLVHEMHWRTRDGQELLVSWRNAVVRDAQGRVRYVISAGHDVTEQRQLELQVRQARKLESLGTLVGGIAHDFNNQLTVILGNLMMVQGDLEGSPADTVRPRLQEAEEAARCCAEITQRLLTFSSGNMMTTSQVVLDEILAESVQRLRPTLPPDILLELHQEPSLWPVVGDASQLQQVLLNLAANACEAMTKGGVLKLALANRVLQQRECQFDAEARPGRFVELRVTDAGEGMTIEVLSRLFEPFFTTKQPGRAAGMGLAIVYGIVKAHKGWINVHSEPGHGSTFRVFLPVAGSSIVGRPEVAPPAQGGSECILVVEDEDLVRHLVEVILGRGGYDVLSACDGEQALEVYRTNLERIALVMLDYSMPKMNGLEVLREMQKLNSGVRAIFSSGFTRTSDSSDLLASGARDFLPKPYHPDELLRVVRRVLDQQSRSSTMPG
jgi:PAS domain S-box-containing protein